MKRMKLFWMISSCPTDHTLTSQTTGQPTNQATVKRVRNTQIFIPRRQNLVIQMHLPQYFSPPQLAKSHLQFHASHNLKSNPGRPLFTLELDHKYTAATGESSPMEPQLRRLSTGRIAIDLEDDEVLNLAIRGDHSEYPHKPMWTVFLRRVRSNS